jgi:hypothetical protein
VEQDVNTGNITSIRGSVVEVWFDSHLPAIHTSLLTGHDQHVKMEVFFVIRHKKNMAHTITKERELPENKAQHVVIDQEVELTNVQSQSKYPGRLRRVAVRDEENQQTIELITNNFNWAAQTIGDLYKSRWKVEVFFRDIKQLLHIRTFIGTSKNAVMIQIWTALITILPLKVMRATAKYKWHISNLVAFIRLNIFVKIELQKWLNKPFFDHKEPPPDEHQGVLFEV